MHGKIIWPLWVSVSSLVTLKFYFLFRRVVGGFKENVLFVFNCLRTHISKPIINPRRWLFYKDWGRARQIYLKNHCHSGCERAQVLSSCSLIILLRTLRWKMGPSLIHSLLLNQKVMLTYLILMALVTVAKSSTTKMSYLLCNRLRCMLELVLWLMSTNC